MYLFNATCEKQLTSESLGGPALDSSLPVSDLPLSRYRFVFYSACRPPELSQFNAAACVHGPSCRCALFSWWVIEFAWKTQVHWTNAIGFKHKLCDLSCHSDSLLHICWILVVVNAELTATKLRGASSKTREVPLHPTTAKNGSGHACRTLTASSVISSVGCYLRRLTSLWVVWNRTVRESETIYTHLDIALLWIVDLLWLWSLNYRALDGFC